jgi:hypothetical protein
VLPLIFIGAIGVCILAAWIAWKLLERPALRMSRWIKFDADDREPPQPAAVPIAASTSVSGDQR